MRGNGGKSHRHPTRPYKETKDTQHPHGGSGGLSKSQRWQLLVFENEWSKPPRIPSKPRKKCMTRATQCLHCPKHRPRAAPVHSSRATRDTCNGRRRHGCAAASLAPRTGSSPRQLAASTSRRDCAAADSVPSVPLRNARVSVMRLSMRSASRVSPRVNEGNSSWLKCLWL